MSACQKLIASRKIIVTCGTGGVGKTTVSAALAFKAASLGRRVCVVTIDPAKRLATSLGIGAIGDTPVDVTAHFVHAWAASVTGTVHALMPDTTKSFEAFVRELAPNPGAADRVMRNPIYQIFAREFSGTNEYMALERLYALNREERFDCIILDTPPSRNTLQFLKAPELLARFFDERLIRWLVLPSNKIVSSGMKMALGLLEKLTGAGFMTNLLEFAAALFEVRARFSANLHRVMDLMRSDQVGFVMVAALAPDLADEVNRFAHVLRDQRFRLDGLLLNRSLLALRPGALPEAPIASSSEWQRALEVLEGLRARENGASERLKQTGVQILARIPELARDVHSVEDLAHVARALD